MTSGALDVSRDKVFGYMFLRRVRGHVLAQRTGHAVTHTLRASSHEFPCRQNFDRSGAVVEHHACSHLRAGTGAVKDHTANTSLTVLWLERNEVGDAGAAALADALQAMVLTCRKCVFRACVCCHRKCPFTKSCQELASSTCWAVCVAAFLISRGLKERFVFFHLCVTEICAWVVLKLMWHGVRTELG